MPISLENFQNKLRTLALQLFVASLPFSLMVNNVAIGILTINWLFESSFPEKWKRIKGNPLVYCFTLFYVLSVIGLVYTENMQQGLFELEKKLTLALFPLILSSSNPISKVDIRKIFKAFILSCTGASIVCFSYAIYRNYEEGHTLSYVFNALFFDIHFPGRYYYFNYWYFTYSFFADGINMHPVYFAMFIVFSSCLTVWLWWDKSGHENGISIWVILFLFYNFIVVVLLSSRTQLFSLLLIGTSFILYYTYLRQKLIKGLLFIVTFYVAGFTILFINPISNERFFKSMRLNSHYSENKFGEGGLSLRTYQWRYTLETIAQNPLAGTGTGDAQDELQVTYKKNNFKIGYDNNFNPHNQYLQSALELGLLGLISFIASLLFPAWLSIKRRAWLYFVFIVLFVFSCLTESLLEVNKGIVFYSFFNALLAFNFLKADD